MKVFTIICRILSAIIIILLICLIAVMTIPKLMGLEGFAVLSGSMEPAIPVGALVYDMPFDPETSVIDVGDVVSYKIGDGSDLVTHRVVSVDEETNTVVTKGDANETNDAAPVPLSSITGKVSFSVPFVGYVAIYGKTGLGIGVACGIIALLILLMYLPPLLSRNEEKSSDTASEQDQ